MNIGIIGLGLIGGSFAKAIKNKHTVYGYDLDANVLLKAQMINAVHFVLTEKDYKKLDMLFIATYPRSFKKILEYSAPLLKSGAIVLDMGGIKRTVVSEMEAVKNNYPNLSFIAAHPMAGREYSGIEHSSINLFNGASVLIVNVHSEMTALTLVRDLFNDAGFEKVIVTTAEKHDKIIAYTSQLAHIISSSYIKSDCANEHCGYSAGSFRDLTRVARLNKNMWTELFMDNRDNLISELDKFIMHLTEYKTALEKKDEEYLSCLLDEGNCKKLDIDEKTKSWKKSEDK